MIVLEGHANISFSLLLFCLYHKNRKKINKSSAWYGYTIDNNMIFRNINHIIFNNNEVINIY